MPQRIPLKSDDLERRKIHHVEPVYPPLAAELAIQGTVLLAIVIGPDGRMQGFDPRHQRTPPADSGRAGRGQTVGVQSDLAQRETCGGDGGSLCELPAGSRRRQEVNPRLEREAHQKLRLILIAVQQAVRVDEVLRAPAGDPNLGRNV